MSGTWLWLAVALTALGLLVMLGAASCMTEVGQRWPARIFDTGAGIFALALLFWLIVAIVAVFGVADIHAT